MPPLFAITVLLGLAAQTAGNPPTPVFESQYASDEWLASVIRGAAFPAARADQQRVLTKLKELAAACSPGGSLHSAIPGHTRIADWCRAAATPKQTVSRALANQTQSNVQVSLRRMRDLRSGQAGGLPSGPGIWFNRFDERFLQWRIHFDPASDFRSSASALGLTVGVEVFEPLRPEIHALWEAAKQRAATFPAPARPSGGASQDSSFAAMVRAEILRRHRNATVVWVSLESPEFTVYRDRVWPTHRFKRGTVSYRLPEEDSHCRLQQFHYSEKFDLWKGGYQKPPPPEQDEAFLGPFQITRCPE